MPSSPSLIFVKIVVSDLDGAVRFYEDVLSMKVTRTFERPGQVEKRLACADDEGGFAIILYHPTDQRAISLGNGWGPVGFRVGDVDAVYQRAIEHGGQPSRAPSEIGGMRVAFFLDPEGHEIELIGLG